MGRRRVTVRIGSPAFYLLLGIVGAVGVWTFYVGYMMIFALLG